MRINFGKELRTSFLGLMFAALALQFADTCAAEPASKRCEIPKLVRLENRVDLMVDGAPWLCIAGELRNSSASTLTFMEPIWDHLNELHVNTVFAPVYWEMVEPVEGQFDFSLAEGLIHKAREHNLRLGLLWLGTWKNGISSYVPAWVMQNRERFPMMSKEALSPFGKETLKADKQAFAALMRFLRKIGQKENTVILVQVENEVGLLSDTRDRSPLAEKAFAGPVPQALMESLSNNEAALKPYLRQRWQQYGGKTSGSWAEVFGESPATDEYFMAWHIATYVNAVAKAGKAEYPIPMYVNPWPPLTKEAKPGDYPSGGPNNRVLDIWMAASPDIDVYALDAYYRFDELCGEMMHRGNPLLIPEAAGWWAGDSPDSGPAKAYYVFGELDALCFSPFGIDNQFYQGHLLGPAYQELNRLMPLITKYRGTFSGADRMRGFYRRQKEKNEELELDGWKAKVTYVDTPNALANYDSTVGVNEAYGSFGLIIQTGKNEFVISARGCQVGIKPTTGEDVASLYVEEGHFEGNSFIVRRVLEGDEVWGGEFPGPRFPPDKMPVINEGQLATVRLRAYTAR